MAIHYWIFPRGPGLGAFEFLPGTGDGVDLLWGFTGTIRLGMWINPFAAHSDRVVRRSIINGGVGNEVMWVIQSQIGLLVHRLIAILVELICDRSSDR